MKKRKEAWNRAALKNPLYCVVDCRKDWDIEEFFKTGIESLEKHTTKFFTDKHLNPAGKRVLDIGCGVGRMARAFSTIFGEVYGVDISGEMIKKAKELNKGITNLHFYENNGLDLSMFEDNFFDFCFSAIVFQHIPSAKIIKNYIDETYRVLKPGGLFKFQTENSRWVTTSLPFPIHRQLWNSLLKARLPLLIIRFMPFANKYNFDTTPGIKLSPGKYREMMEDAGFGEIGITGENTKEMWCSCRKPKR